MKSLYSRETRNLQVLMTEIYEIINHCSASLEIRENTHNTRYFQVLSSGSSRTVNYGLETIYYRAPVLWANLPPEYKLPNSVNIFKRKIKEKIVHVGYAKHLLENWATFNFPRSLSISVTFFFLFFNTIKKPKIFKHSTVYRKKVLKNQCILFILLSVDLN